jgi:microcystin-dependent protein
MVTRVDPFLGGLGIDATGKFEVQANATVTVGDGTSTGNVIVGNSVGIGTASPSGKFDVAGSSGAVRINAAGDQISYTYNGFNYITASGAAAHMRIQASGASGVVSFGTNSAERMRITSAGNVGIGTSSPNYPLDITAGALGGTSGDTVNLLELAHTVNNASYLRFEGLRTSTGTSWNSAGTRIQQVIDSTDMGYIQFNGDGNDYGISFGKGASTEYVRIDTSGNVGIGTTSPDGILNVHRASASAGWIINGQTVGVANDSGLYMDASNNIELSVRDGSGTHTAAVRSSGYTFFNGGNVGIGTSSPSAILTINDDATTGTGLVVTGGGGGGPLATFTRDVGSTGTVTIHSSGGDPQMSFNSGTNVFAIGADGTSFKISDNTSVGTNDRLTIDSSGNVGIGTTAPATLLHVVGGTIKQERTTGDNNAFLGYVGSTNNSYIRLQNTAGYVDLTANNGSATLNNSQAITVFNTSSSERMRIDGSGNVGIGTTDTNLFDGVGGVTRLAVCGSDTSTNVANNSSANIAVINTDTTAGNTAAVHFARADTDDTPNYAGASIVAQFPDTQVTGQYPKGLLAFLTSTAANQAPSEKMRITSSGDVGIGTNSPVFTAGGGVMVQNTTQANYRLADGTNYVDLLQSSGAGYLWNRASNFLSFGTNNTERMRIESTGVVIISGPSLRLNDNIEIEFGTGGGATDAQIAWSGTALEFDVNGGPLYLDMGNDNDFYIRDVNSSYAQALKVDVSAGDVIALTNVNAANGKLQEGGNSLIPPGSIIMYGAAAAPGGWLLCEGGAISRTTYADLFSAISTTYGAGDGSTTFNVPDFRDRAPYGASTFLLGSKTAGEVDASGQNSTGTGTSGSSGATTVASNTGTGTTGTGTTGTGTTGTSTSGGTAPTIPAATYNTGTATSGGSGATTVAANTGNAGATTVAANTGSAGDHGHTVTTSTTNSTTDKDVTNAITVVTGVANVGGHTHAIPELTVNAHAHSIPSLTVNSHTHSVPALSIPEMTVNSHTHSVPGLSVPGLSVPGLSVPALTIPSLTVNGHTHSVPALTVTHPGVAVKFIIKT